jgi:hypothetical protein
MSRASTLEDQFRKEFQAAVANNTVFNEAQVRAMLTYFVKYANTPQMESALAVVSMDQLDLVM